MSLAVAAHFLTPVQVSKEFCSRTNSLSSLDAGAQGTATIKNLTSQY